MLYLRCDISTILQFEVIDFGTYFHTKIIEQCGQERIHILKCSSTHTHTVPMSQIEEGKSQVESGNRENKHQK